ncbi:hypothetical protein GE21DRAFT_2202 [Neurospora crassa]|uniref:Uncharacterized protein n=1 Tax=Neurospora crassa (strain ATCC 24698 / 74-OR23-1A / CBS 708.71 / DSM 1257 / FGSC 987) TaxID=367110 RepID=Q7SDL0_NEUCR|nr:hypothetical protein NCU00534 [Neurospora crassa OR74A]EAA34850.1 hypothetical protein NCU00534 [Neurospora crassa OR74A]KHE85116.1 hypothetical protein GE21DRAFT_2202 [Neurospora crassa]|eukprot:XP_964086.1 hypothetical protein NCU00534 [Neurospora crassa OR74A]
MSLNRWATQKALPQSVSRTPAQRYRDVSTRKAKSPRSRRPPRKSWESGNEKSEFNWATDKDEGVVKDFAKARILLYMHESV